MRCFTVLQSDNSKAPLIALRDSNILWFFRSLINRRSLGKLKQRNILKNAMAAIDVCGKHDVYLINICFSGMANHRSLYSLN